MPGRGFSLKELVGTTQEMKERIGQLEAKRLATQELKLENAQLLMNLRKLEMRLDRDLEKEVRGGCFIYWAMYGLC